MAFAIVSDALRQRAGPMLACVGIGFSAALTLAIWDVPAVLKWAAFLLQRAAVPYGPLAMSWANEICGGDAEERAVVLGAMNALGYAFNAWVPFLTYPQVDAPRFRRGFVFTTCAAAAQGLITLLVAHMHARDQRRAARLLAAADEEEDLIAPREELRG